MFEDIQKHRQAVAENIEKSFQIGFTESEDLQKAHNVGDVHPNGNWVQTHLPSGKYDWRVIKKTAQSNTGSGITGKTASSSAVPQSSSQKNNSEESGKNKKVKPSSNKKSSALIEDTLQKIKQFSYIYWDDKKVPSIKESLEENEKIVRSVMRAAFPSASSGSAISPNTNKVDIDGQDFTFGAYYTINTTSRNPSDRGSKTNHYFVKNDSGKTIASYTSSGRWNTPTDAKNSCKVDVLRRLLKL